MNVSLDTKEPRQISPTLLTDLAESAVADRQPVWYEKLISTFYPRYGEKRIEAEITQWSELITALSIRYPIVSEWITKHKNDSDPVADESESFFIGYKQVFDDRDNAIADTISLGHTLKDKTIPAREVIGSIRNTTIQAENAISKSLITNVIIRMKNDHRLETPDQIRNVLAAAAVQSSQELRVYTSQGNTEYSTLKHTEKIVDFIYNTTNVNDSSVLKQLVAMCNQNTESISLYAREKARLDKLAYEALIEQASLVGKDASPQATNDIVQKWSEYSTAASQAGENRRRLVEINGIFELLFKGNIAEISEAMLRLPNIL